MDSKIKHVDLIKAKGQFQIDCSHAIFSEGEMEILKNMVIGFKQWQMGDSIQLLQSKLDLWKLHDTMKSLLLFSKKFGLNI